MQTLPCQQIWNDICIIVDCSPLKIKVNPVDMVSLFLVTPKLRIQFISSDDLFRRVHCQCNHSCVSPVVWNYWTHFGIHFSHYLYFDWILIEKNQFSEVSSEHQVVIFIIVKVSCNFQKFHHQNFTLLIRSLYFSTVGQKFFCFHVTLFLV